MIDSIEKFRGVFAAFYAFYNDDGTISVERTKAAAKWTVKKGVQGLYLTGSSGEGMLIASMKAILEARGILNGGVRAPFKSVPKDEPVIREDIEMIESWV